MIPSGSAISGTAIAGRLLSQEIAGVIQSRVSAAIASGSVGDYRLRAATSYFVPQDEENPQPYYSTLRQNFTVEKSLLGGGGFSGVSVTLVRIELDNHEALYDGEVGDYDVEGEEIILKVGEVVDGRADYSSFHTIGVFVGVRHIANETTFAVEARDKIVRLEVPARKSAVYAGTGNLEGGEEVAGKNRPWALGWCYGVTAAPILPVEYIDQVSDGMCLITACYDDGAEYDFTADYADLAALRAATLVPGQFATCNALGLARRGGRPFGKVTYDVKGYSADGVFIETTADILRDVILAACEVDEAELSESAFDLVNIDQPAARGYYFAYDSNETVLQFANTWMRGVLGFINVDRTGLIEPVLINPPSIVASEYYDETQFKDIRREPLPEPFYPPPQRVLITYAHNETPLDRVVGDVTDPQRIAVLKEPYQVASSSDASAALILADYPSAKAGEPVPGHFKERDDAATEAQRQFDFLTGRRALYDGTIPLHPFVHDLADTINVTRPRYELANGADLVLMRIRNDIAVRAQEVTGLT